MSEESRKEALNHILGKLCEHGEYKDNDCAKCLRAELFLDLLAAAKNALVLLDGNSLTTDDEGVEAKWATWLRAAIRASGEGR